MAIIGINDNRPRRFDISGGRIRFTAHRWIGKRFPFDPRRLIFNPGTEALPNLQLTGAAPQRAFFNANHLSGSRSMVIGLHRHNADGSLAEPVRWVSIGKFRGLYTTFIKPLLGRSIGNIAREEIVGRDLHLTHITDKRLVVINDLNIEAERKEQFYRQVEAIPQAWVDHATLENDNRTLRVHLAHPSSQRDLGHVDIDISFLKLPRNIYQNPEDPRYHIRLFSHSEEIDILERNANGDITRSRPKFVLEYFTCKRGKIRNAIPAGVVGADFRATVVRVKSSIEVRHLNPNNGRGAGASEVLPFDHKPAAVPRHLHFDSNPEALFGSRFRDGKIDTMVSPQHLIEYVEDSNKGWPTRDQKFFFGEKKKSRYAFPYGQVEGRPSPWHMPDGAHSLQYEKTLVGAAIHTGSNSQMVGPWRRGIYQYDEIGHEVPKPNSLFHPRSITEDALGAKEKKQTFGEETREDRNVLAIARCIDHVGQGKTQRRRWAAMIGEWLSFGSHYAVDELVRCRLYGKLAFIPYFNARKIESVYTAEQLHNWLNVGTWYLDTLCKYVFASIPIAYVFFGLTPLPATATFLAFWILKTIFGWAAYSYQDAKMTVNPKRTFFPFPRDIFLWYLYVPTIAQGMYHIEDEAVGPFANTITSGGKHLSPTDKRHLFWFFTAIPAATAAWGAKALIFSIGVAHAGAFAAAFIPLGIGIAATIAAVKVLNRLIRNPNTRSFWKSAIKFAVPAAVLCTAAGFTIGALAGFEVLSFMGLLMNIFWPAYMAAGTIYALSIFYREQKAMVGRGEIKPDDAEALPSLFRDAFAVNEIGTHLIPAIRSRLHL